MQTEFQQMELENKTYLRGSQIFRILSCERAKFLACLTIQTQTPKKKSKFKC